MKKIFSSAPKLVLVLIVLSTCIALFLNKITEQNFMLVIGPVLAFFFSYKPKDETGQINK